MHDARLGAGSSTQKAADGGGWAVRAIPSWFRLAGSFCERASHSDDQPRRWTFSPKSLIDSRETGGGLVATGFRGGRTAESAGKSRPPPGLVK